MLDPNLFDELSKKVASSLPAGLAALQADTRKNLHRTVEAALSKLDLVSREEFDIQSAILARTRSKLEDLERQIAELESRLKHT